MSGKVIFDTNFLTYFSDAAGGFDFKPVDEFDTLEDRFDLLMEQLAASAKEVIIPAPVLAEVLAAKHANEENILSIISNEANIRISDFDKRQGIEFGCMYRNIARGPENRNSFKFDMLILTCARVEGVRTIYTADKNLKKKAQDLGIQAISFQELERPYEQEDKIPDLFSSIN